VWSFSLKQKGAGFEMEDRHQFIKGLVPTDIEFGLDGGAYITDWMGNFNKQQKGRIIRIFNPEAATSAIVLQTKRLIKEGMTQRGEQELIGLLGHTDGRVRQAAQFELASRGNGTAKALAALATNGAQPQLARIHAMWALGQIARKSPSGTLEPLLPLLGDGDDEIQVQAIKMLGEARVAAAYEPILKLLTDSNSRIRYFAAMNVGRYGNVAAIPAILTVLTQNDNKDPYLRHGAVMGLAYINDAGALASLTDNPSPAARMGVALALRHLKNPEIAKFLNDADPAVVLEAARAINDVPIEQANPPLAALIDPIIAKKNTSQPLVHRVLSANFRLGGGDNVRAVAAYAASNDAIEILRVEALQMLNEWAKPRGINRVTGNWQPYNTNRDGASADAWARKILPDILKNAPDSVRSAAIVVAERVGTDDPNALFDLVSNAKAGGDVRAAALKSMANTKDPRLQEAAVVGLNSGHGPLRAESIRQQAGLPGAVEQFEKLLAGNDIADQQAVLQALGKVEGDAIDQILVAWLDKLAAGKVPAEIQLDLLESAGKIKSPAVQEKLMAYNNGRAKEDVLAQYRECLAGGDPKLGREVFTKRADVSCTRCHVIDGKGGSMGPDIKGLGTRKDRNYILESILAPNKVIAPGFEAATIKLKNNNVLNGVVKGETATELQMVTETGPVTIAKADITIRKASPSPMPDNIAQPLSKQDLRNLVEFLASQK
jgi:quinoprotein glucose dehydrogenase